MPADDLQSEPDEAVLQGGDEADQKRGYGLWPKQWRWRISLLLLVLIGLVASAAWLGREKIAGDFIDDALAANGLQASYDIVSIGTNRQVIANLVVGDPQAPDLTAEQVSLDIAYTFGAPEIGGVELVRPRLYGQVVDGQLSFGSLDPLIYTESDAPPGLPSINLKVDDGRALVESEWGAIGAKLNGQGRLSDGFEGILAVTAPGIGTDQCMAENATLYGDLTTLNGRVTLDGPLRLRSVSCAGAEVVSADVAARLTVWEDLSSIDGDLAIEALGLSYDGAEIASVSGDAQMLFGGSAETGLRLGFNHDLTVAGLVTGFGSLGSTRLEGDLTLSDGFARTEWRAGLRATDIQPVGSISNSIADARNASEGTLVEALLARFETGLTEAFATGELSGDIVLRNDESGLRITVPQARLRNGSGDAVLALSNGSYGNLGEGEQVSGNILTGGPDLPLINGRMERRRNGDLALRLTMAEYSAGENSLAIPRMELRQSASGRVSFNGLVRAGGELPGGAVRGLEMPLEGTWSSRAGLSVGPRCINVSLAALELSELVLADRTLRLCPDGGAMLRYGDALEVAAFSEMVDIAGSLGSSPAQITVERADMRYPQSSTLSGLNAVIGETDNAVRLSAAELDLQIGEEVGGSFTSGTAALDVVPLDLSELAGNWRFDEGALTIEDGAFVLSERPEPDLRDDPRFWPLEAKGASLSLIDNRISAEADLRHPASQALISKVTIAHDLGTQVGRTDIDVPGVTFTNDGLAPSDLSELARGVIAIADGTVSGRGEVTWEGDNVESEGTFRTDNFDFGAAFGPVQGARGEIVFTDLINLTTAPRQVLEVDVVDPGIQAFGGRIVYSMTGGQLITVEDARWPFMGGELILRPVELNYGEGEGQDYIFELVGLDAAAFVAQMEMDNLDATGTFDGTIPIYFDASGNGFVQNGLLIARSPGGNIAYVGELTYEDMGGMANYAFQSLRSLDYNQMSVELNGSLSGEIVTNFRIDGVRQGEGASQNFVTRRLAKLPIRFNVNVRSDSFMNLSTIVRGWNDPSAWASEAVLRRLGLEQFEQAPPAPSEPQTLLPPSDALRRDEPINEPSVQPSESDDLR